MVSQNSNIFYEKKTFKEVSRKPFTLKEKQDPWYYSIKHLLLFQKNALISIEHIFSTVSQCLSYYPSCGPCPWDYTCKLQRFPFPIPFYGASLTIWSWQSFLFNEWSTYHFSDWPDWKKRKLAPQLLHDNKHPISLYFGPSSTKCFSHFQGTIIGKNV